MPDISHILIRDSMRYRLVGSRGDDPVLPERMPRRRRRRSPGNAVK
jgi:hypothetical protein